MPEHAAEPRAEHIYLDHNATTPVAAEVAESMWPYLTDRFGNPSSDTPHGRQARLAVDRGREQVAALIGAHPDEIVFSSGGTESNNLAIRGAAAAVGTPVLVTSAVEHPATQQPVSQLREAQGWSVHELAVDRHARVDAGEVLSGAIGLATVILAHNEVGTIQPIADVAAAVHDRGGVVHTDAAQAVGKIPVFVDRLGVDLLSIAGHKLYAPKGVGALYIRRGTTIAPVLVGAGQERGLRPGTENVAGIVGLGTAAELAARVLADEPSRQSALRETLWTRLQTGIPHLVRVTPDHDTLPNTLMIAVPDQLGADILDRARGISASTGSACHSGIHTASETLVAMGIPESVALGAIRLSLGRSTTDDDISRAAESLIAAVR
jgi:cysteine desulfurase